MPPSPPRTPSVRPAGPQARRSAEVFRAAIEKGTQEGYSLDDMLLRLTLGDASELKRDRSLAVEDISFTDGVLPEIVERDDHIWFVGVQYHPELKSRPFAPHPLFASFIAAAKEQSRLV